MDSNDITGSQYAQGTVVDPESDEDERIHFRTKALETDGDDITGLQQ